MAVPKFEEGDRVRVDIPDESDPDFELHGKHGTVITVATDDAGRVTGDRRDAVLYRVALESGDECDLRGRDLRQPIE